MSSGASFKLVYRAFRSRPKTSVTLPPFIKEGAGGGGKMGVMYNRAAQKEYRQHLRTHSTRAELVL